MGTDADRRTHPALLVTDFAGTTMRDDGTVLAAYRVALDAFQIPFSEDDLAARRGASKRAVFRELAARVHGPDAVNDVAEQALRRFEQALREQYETGEIAEIPGAARALDQLKRSGIKLALTTGFDRGLLDLLVSRLAWGTLFDLTLASSDAPAGRPAPFLIYRAMIDLNVGDVRQVAVVGDTPLDLQSGTNAQAGW
ncbi:MAG TPA: HAD hydrolase-like protein, partial [Nitrolancea sp.]|nr:HAD hydrolase-like protein [Nitrolancea sp.]